MRRSLRQAGGGVKIFIAMIVAFLCSRSITAQEAVTAETLNNLQGDLTISADLVLTPDPSSPAHIFVRNLTLQNVRIVTSGRDLMIATNRLTSNGSSIVSFANSAALATTPDGRAGVGGGVVDIYVLDSLDGALRVDLRGQNGANGASGPGGTAGAAGVLRGADARSVQLPFPGMNQRICITPPTFGPPGAAGGAGGPGGNGGDGGDGGVLRIHIAPHTASSPSAGFQFSAAGGAGGQGGSGGVGGAGGGPGPPGAGQPGCPGPINGASGSAGPRGPDGHAGRTGAEGRLVTLVIPSTNN